MCMITGNQDHCVCACVSLRVCACLIVCVLIGELITIVSIACFIFVCFLVRRAKYITMRHRTVYQFQFVCECVRVFECKCQCTFCMYSMYITWYKMFPVEIGVSKRETWLFPCRKQCFISSCKDYTHCLLLLTELGFPTGSACPNTHT